MSSGYPRICVRRFGHFGVVYVDESDDTGFVNDSDARLFAAVPDDEGQTVTLPVLGVPPLQTIFPTPWQLTLMDGNAAATMHDYRSN